MKNLYKESFEALGKSWLLDLNNYNEVPFKRKTSKVRWSLGEIYEHLGLITNHHVQQIESCFSSSSEGKKSWSGKLVFIKGSASNGKLMKFNSSMFIPSQPEEIKDARDTMYRVLKAMEEWGRKITDENPKGKIEHPVLGMLSALEWYKLIVMQFEYHYKNKEKIHQLLIH